jgi:hypothetical protein
MMDLRDGANSANPQPRNSGRSSDNGTATDRAALSEQRAPNRCGKGSGRKQFAAGLAKWWITG